ncbi:PIG-L family deacetylase [Stackebrandtia soli]|uniref:PIG-L family deacetylase n=1 Tax=Stackebrandtia soli TaxID=1892856 RepID=UPI0039E743D5
MTGYPTYFPPPPPPQPRRVGPTRRKVLALGAAGAGGVAAIGVGASLWASSGGDQSNATELADKLRADHMQVIAHPDDDLFFNNLDILNGLASGASQMTVCLTCGEADGFNGSKARKGGKPDFQGYTAARYQGLRSAYAYMVTGDADAPWTREALPLGRGHVAEIATLDGNDSAKLVFLNMWVNAQLVDEVENGRLYHLWQDRSDNQPTMVVPGSPVTGTYRYTREDVLNTLTELFRMVRPRVIRTMDLDPDSQVHNDDNRQYADQTGFSDSYDHTPTALFTWAAYLRWRESAGGQDALITSYRGYYNRRWPANLSENALERKAPPIDIYGWNDHRVCGAEFGCGDLNVSGIGTTGGYGLSTIVRYPERTDWAILGNGGRINAVTTIGSRVLYWTEREPGSGTWTEPVPLNNDYLLPEPTVAPAGDGTWSIQGIRPKVTPSNQNHIREIVRADIPGRAAMAYWETLGNPAAINADPVERRGVGQPVFLRGRDGTRYVFARNFDRSFSYRRRSDDTWSDWELVSGPTIQDGLSAIVGDGGAIHVFAAGQRGIVQWTSTGGGWTYRELDGVSPAAPPTVARLADGRIAVATREAESTEVVLYVLTSDGHQVEGGARMLSGRTGTGSVAMLPWKNANPGATLAIRTDSGQVSFAEWDPNRDRMEWTEPDGPMCIGLPSLVFDANNVARALMLGHDARLYTAKQGADGSGPIAGWKQVEA